VSTIKRYAPGLLSDKSEHLAPPIPDEMPEGFSEKFKKIDIADIGEPTTACFFTGTDIDPAKW